MSATAHEGLAGKAWLEAFRSLEASAVKELHKDSDKDAVAALQSLSSALQHSHALDFQALSHLITCGVDQVSGD